MNLPIQEHEPNFSTTGQISPQDLTEIAEAGFRSIICNRPDGEGGAAQPISGELSALSEAMRMRFAYLPIAGSQVSDAQATAFGELLSSLPGPVLAYCRTGNRSTALHRRSLQLRATKTKANAQNAGEFDVVIVGAGAAGIGVASSLLRRRKLLRIALIDPSATHAYQAAWTLVGGGAFDAASTERPMASVIPKGTTWLQSEVTAFAPSERQVCLNDGRRIGYQQLIICPGLRLAWECIEGLAETLGKNGVTSNYRRDLAPYTWELVQGLDRGKALFSQPPMPIKCAGAPQKAMYLSCDHWLRRGVLKDIDVEFNLAGQALFGVAVFVPPLMKYIQKYEIRLGFSSTLVRVDGPARTAWFDIKQPDGSMRRESRQFEMLHAVPPQVSPDVVRTSPFANAEGWCEVDQTTLQHPRHAEVFSLGDVCSAPNAKTVAAVRKQVVVVAENLLAYRDGKPLTCRYDGYGACPLTVERGKVVLAEFGFGGKLLPTFPLAPDVARRSAWWLKVLVLPWVYWNLLLKGREWLTNVARA
jgi:sulfide:quinone oxidoreductase